MSFYDLSIPEMCTKIESAYSEMAKSGVKWAKSKALYESILEKKKPMLGMIQKKYEGSQSLKEGLAYADFDYATYLDGLNAAYSNYLMDQVSYDNAKLKIECLRSLISARKEEVKNFRG